MLAPLASVYELEARRRVSVFVTVFLPFFTLTFTDSVIATVPEQRAPPQLSLTGILVPVSTTRVDSTTIRGTAATTRAGAGATVARAGTTGGGSVAGSGITEFEGLDALLVPTEFVAVTVKV